MTSKEGLVNVKFRITCPHVPEGSVLCVTGSHRALGQWDPKLTHELEKRTGDLWTGTVTLPAGDYYQWKVLMKESDGHVSRWEERANRILKVNYNVTVIHVTFDWNGPAIVGQVYGECFRHSEQRCLAAKLVKLAFTTSYQTSGPTYDLGVVGSLPELGSWNPSGAVILSNDVEGYHGRWTGFVEVPSVARFQWKFVVIDGQSKYVQRWEERGNRSYTVKPFSCELFASWNEREQENPLFCECKMDKLDELFQHDWDCPRHHAEDHIGGSMQSVTPKRSALKIVSAYGEKSADVRKKSVNFADDLPVGSQKIKLEHSDSGSGMFNAVRDIEILDDYLSDTSALRGEEKMIARVANDAGVTIMRDRTDSNYVALQTNDNASVANVATVAGAQDLTELLQATDKSRRKFHGRLDTVSDAVYAKTIFQATAKSSRSQPDIKTYDKLLSKTSADVQKRASRGGRPSDATRLWKLCWNKPFLDSVAVAGIAALIGYIFYLATRFSP